MQRSYGRAGGGPRRRSLLVWLPDGRRETSFVVLDGDRLVGVARALPRAEGEAADAGARPAHPTASGVPHEIGVWIAGSSRGRGVAGAVVEALAEHVRRAGGSCLVADTTADDLPARAVLRRAGARAPTPGDDPGAVHARIDL